MKDDIYKYLKLDHQKVAKLFDLFITAPTAENQLEIFKMIKQELLVHAISEQEVFYKTLASFPESKKDIRHSEKEHRMILDKLDEIDEEAALSSTAVKKVMELKNIVEHHVGEEEGPIFREAKKLLTDEEALVLKWKMHDLKGKLLIEMTRQEKVT